MSTEPNGEVVEIPINMEVGQRLRLKRLLELQTNLLAALSNKADPRVVVALTANAVMTLIACERDRIEGEQGK